MNIWATNRFHFDEAASGTGDTAPAVAPVATPTAPSSTPEPAPATPAPSGGAPSSPAATAPGSDPFGGLDSDFDSDLDEIILAEAPPTDGGTSPTTQAPPAAPAPVPAATTPPSASPPAPAPAAAPAPAPSVTSPASPGAQLDETIQGFKDNAPALSEWAAENLFKLSDADAALLVTDAEKVIPRLMGQVYTQALAAAGNLLRNFGPQMIDHQVEQSTLRTAKSKEAIGAFYAANPDLNEKDHKDSVALWAKTFRAANPKASREEAIKFVGNAVRLQHGLAAPSAPPAPRAQPFAPARPGGRNPTPAPQTNAWDGLDQDFDE